MSRYIDAEWLIKESMPLAFSIQKWVNEVQIMTAPSIDIVRCEECRKSHIDGKTTHYLWCTEWGRSTDTFGYCERGEREGE